MSDKDTIEVLRKTRPATAAIVDAFVARHGDLAALAESMIAAHDAMVKAVDGGGTLFFCGNGGSMADALHIKGELGKSFVLKRPIRDWIALNWLTRLPMGLQLAEGIEVGIPAIVLGESLAQASAYANDRDPVLVFAQDLVGHVCRSKSPHVLMGLSTSGSSKNVMAAMTLAKAYGVTTVSLTGPGGGSMAEMADIAIKAPGEDTPTVQEAHVRIYHALCLMIEATFFGDTQA